jgi:hypothetical protein
MIIHDGKTVALKRISSNRSMKLLLLTLVVAIIGAQFFYMDVVQADTTEKTLYSFGSNNNGRTGLNTNAGNTIEPTLVNADLDWSEIVAGDSHTLAVKMDGTLFSFGFNFAGQTGQGLTSGFKLVPTQIGADNNWLHVAAGNGFSSAIKQDGTLFSFGINSNGRTGLNLSGTTTAPVQVGTDGDWSSVEAGNTHTLALKENGTLYTFGRNTSGQTGLNTSAGDALVPTQIGTDSDWSSISAGNGFSLAIKQDGTLFSFGSNASGRTGLNTSAGDTLVPTQIGSDSDWSSVSAGSSHALAIKQDGTLFSFGSNASGRTGLNTSAEDTLVPTQIGTESNWGAITAGEVSSQALRTVFIPSPTTTTTTTTTTNTIPGPEFPNDGDGNNDGIVDIDQPNVTMIKNPVNNGYVVLVSPESCTNERLSVVSETSLPAQDRLNYPAGLLDFSVDCVTPGVRIAVEHYYYDLNYKAEDFIGRKFTTYDNVYHTLSGSSITDIKIGGQHVVKFVYSLTDGDTFDNDQIQNGKIVDPAGLGTSLTRGSLANTGQNIGSKFYLSISLMLIGFALIVSVAKKRRVLIR